MGNIDQGVDSREEFIPFELFETTQFGQRRSKLAIRVCSAKVEKMLYDCQQALKDLKAENSSVKLLTFTLFGSIVRGKSNPNDLDMFAFFDTRDSEAEAQVYCSERPKTAQSLLIAQRVMGSRRELIKEFKRKLFTKGYKSDILPRAISHGIIDRTLEKMRGSKYVYDYLDSEETLSELFLFSLDPDINPYRAYLLDQLLSMGEIGEELWNRVISGTAAAEGEVFFNQQAKEWQSRRTREYPKNPEEAKQYFGL